MLGLSGEGNTEMELRDLKRMGVRPTVCMLQEQPALRNIKINAWLYTFRYTLKEENCPGIKLGDFRGYH